MGNYLTLSIKICDGYKLGINSYSFQSPFFLFSLPLLPLFFSSVRPSTYASGSLEAHTGCWEIPLPQRVC